MSHAASLFNAGLAAAQEGRIREARDLLAAVVHWSPSDVVARNAFALACFRLGDKATARSAWESVLARSPKNDVAIRGLAMLAQRPASHTKKPTAKKAAKKPHGRPR